MKMKILIAICFTAMILSACSTNKKTTEKTIVISSETKPCSDGVKQKDCLQVKWTKDQTDWELFNNEIEGFTYEKGNEYELVVSEEKVKNSSADTSSIKYKLVKEVSKKKVNTPVVYDNHNSQNSLDWAGTYEGTLPCADCEGIKTVIVLNQNNTYVLSEEYLDKKRNPAVTKGIFSWNSDGSKVTLTDGDRKQQYQVGENKLIHLDETGDIITGSLSKNYILQKK